LPRWMVRGWCAFPKPARTRKCLGAALARAALDAGAAALLRAGEEQSVKPLQGKRIVITRPRSQMDALVERLQALGAEPIAFPTIAIVPQTDNEVLFTAIKHLQDYDWLIFTSRNGVEVFWDHFTRVGANLQQLNGLKIAAIGPATAAALAERSAPVHLIPPEYVAEAILEAIGEVRGLRILLPRAEIARPVLADELVRRGAEVNEIAVPVLGRSLPGR
jgi:uroporphyrinogen-III synthase